MRGSREIIQKLNGDKTEPFIQCFVNLQGHLAFDYNSNRNSCGSCSYLIHDFRHYSTSEAHPYCTPRPFCSLTCCCTVCLAVPSVLCCGITTPSLHSFYLWNELPTSDSHSCGSNLPSQGEHHLLHTEQKQLLLLSLQLLPEKVYFICLLLLLYLCYESCPLLLQQ